MLEKLLIKVDNQYIHLSPSLAVSIQQTNIPIKHCTFRSRGEIFWIVELIEYNSDTNCWKMKVVDYSVKENTKFDSQKPIREVKRIAFEKFDWPKFQKYLSVYKRIELLPILDNLDTDRYFREQSPDTEVPSFSAQAEPTAYTHKIEFDVSFSDAFFKLGYVSFSKYIKEVNDRVDFKIKNDFILAEFDNIKSWFAKKLKKRKFTVNANISIADSKVSEVIATSLQISMITVELIDSIKYQRTVALTKSPKDSDIDKSLFTAEEIFSEMESSDIEGNVFNQNEQDVLNILLENYKTRNRKQLEYLSGNKQSEKSKIRFTLHPNFGFLFFIEGRDNNHFAWELLNSNATYIWSIDKADGEMELQFKRIEESINKIRDIGREQYKRAYRQNGHDIDLVFCTIKHDDITSNFVDGFVKWKHRLNEVIT